jgi:hypothetical protein
MGSLQTEPLSFFLSLSNLLLSPPPWSTLPTPATLHLGSWWQATLLSPKTTRTLGLKPHKKAEGFQGTHPGLSLRTHARPQNQAGPWPT